jgi:hypothetical protein
MNVKSVSLRLASSEVRGLHAARRRHRRLPPARSALGLSYPESQTRNRGVLNPQLVLEAAER